MFVRQRTFLGKPGFVVDGAFRPTAGGVLELPDAEGRVRRLSLRGFALDPCPRVVVDGVVVDAFPRLPRWASAACCVPLVLMGGGLVGGIVGIVTIYGNFRIARSRLPPVLRVVAGALLTLSAGGAVVAVSSWVHALGR